MYYPDWKLKKPSPAYPTWSTHGGGVLPNKGSMPGDEDYPLFSTIEETRNFIASKWTHIKPDPADVMVNIFFARLAVLQVDEEIPFEQWVFTIRKVEP